MLCECGGKTRVAETRGDLRRRECLICKARFVTEEVRVSQSPRKQKEAAPEKRKRKPRERQAKTVKKPIVLVQAPQPVKTARERIEDLRDAKCYESATDYFD